MRKFILLILFINSSMVAYNQVIKGTILDKKDQSKIYNASIYFNGTFEGTSSDLDGNFTLNISQKTSMPLIVSSIGYYSVTLTDYSSDKPLIIYLIPKVYEMNPVVISSKSLVKKRKTNLKLFKDIFLGNTDNALSCEITNEKDITFNYSSERDTLKAFASNPIIIYNRELGYKITYYLDKFEFDENDHSFLIKGNIIFNEDLSETETYKKQQYEEKRKSAYLGSRMHFFRELWANSLTQAGFTVKNLADVNLIYENIVVQDNLSLIGPLKICTKFLSYKDNLKIYYQSNLTNIIFLNPKVYFDKTGYFDNISISWEGEMIEKRIGDMLPYEYEMKQ